MSAPELQAIPSYSAEVLPYVTSRYANSPLFLGFLDVACRRMSALELAAFEIQTWMRLAVATGEPLDFIGAVYGVSRSGRSDSEYRAAIWNAASVGYSGTPDEVCSAVALATGATRVEYRPQFPAGFWAVPSSGGGALTQAFLDMLSPAGVQAYPPCFLIATSGQAIVDTTGDYILVVGPCDQIGEQFEMVGNDLVAMSGDEASVMLGVV